MCILAPKIIYPTQPSMKLSRSVTLTALLFALLINYSCDKSDKDNPPNNPPENITAEVYGRVTDNDNVPVQGAVVKAGTANTTTDVNGYFRIRNASLHKTNGFIVVRWQLPRIRCGKIHSRSCRITHAKKKAGEFCNRQRQS